MHTNDELYLCRSPTFGRNLQDQVESGKAWRASCTCQPEHQGHLASQLVDDRHADDECGAEGDRGPDYTFSGRTRITLGTAPGKMTVVTGGVSSHGTTRPTA